MKQPPNFLVVILDAARSVDLPGGSNAIDGMRFCGELLKESLSFPNAVAPSPWTIPSHASLFTGLYPWEHGTHNKRTLRVDPELPTLAGVLGEHGYASFAASSNGFLSLDFGLLNGFRSAAWGEWWERFLHLPQSVLPPRAYNFGPTMRLPSPWLMKRLETPSLYVNRRPILLDFINRFASRLRTPEEPHYSPFISGWIERTVGRWLTQQPATKPVFCFVNFYEAHEPYIIDPSVVEGGMTLRELARMRMDRTNFLAGRWHPTASEYRDLQRLYRAVVGALDERVRRLVEIFRAAGRWDNTVLVLSSDHGQAFGENGFLFHGVRVWESIVRIPLWIRFPDGRYAGARARGWASLVDVMPTLLEEAGVTSPTSHFACRLPHIVDRDRPTPVMAMSDGLSRREILAKLAPAAVVNDWDQPFLAAYQGDTKVIVNVEQESGQLFDLRTDPSESAGVDAAAAPGAGPLWNSALRAARRITERPKDAPDPALDARLRSWGYD